ncbi:MAG: hypothetical protein J0H64_05215, partial [Actinobacteria bacterium]|nr:hypothetical protein [Actinomycetota bacterium]
LTVTMSGERSEPAVERVELLSGSSTVGKCGAYPGEGGQVECVVSGLTPGKANAKTYTARTVNAVGDSETSAASQPTWAYQAPTAPTIESDGPQVWKDNGDPSKGRVRVRIGKAPGNAETVLTIDGDSRQPENNGIYVLKAGQAHTFSVSSKDPDDEAPPGYNGEKQGASNTATATPIGAPQVSRPTLTFSGAESTDWTLSDGTTVGDNLTISYGFKQGLTVSACSPSVQSSGSVGGGGGKWKMYTGLVCVQNDYGRAQAATEPSWAGGDLPLPGGGTVTYTVGGSGNSAPGDAGGSYSYTANAPHYTGLVGSLVYENTGNSTFSVTPDAPETRVKQCKDDHCSDWSTVTAQALKPLEVRLSACVTTQNAQSADIAQSISLIGDPGGTPDYATSGNDIVVTWQGNVRNSFRFSGGYCPA